MTLKSHAHEALFIFFKCKGVPPDIIADGSLEQTNGNFAHKYHEADCYLQIIEPYSPWMNVSEINIQELKRASSRSMLWTQILKCLWDNCLELSVLFLLHSTFNLYNLEGEIPKTKHKGWTANINIQLR